MSTTDESSSFLDRADDETELARETDLTQLKASADEHPDGLLILGSETSIVYANPAAGRLFRRTVASLANVRFISLIHPGDLSEFTEGLRSLDGHPAGLLRCTLRCRLGAGDWGWIECVGRHLPLPRGVGVVLVLKDLGSRDEHLEKLTRLAFTDAVTGLANRTFLTQRLEHRLKVRDLRRNPIGVLSLDLDGFKRVNDMLGHAAGDEVLRQFGERLRRLMRDGDTVARIGGDEFVVLLEDILQLADLAQCAERLQAPLDAPFHLDGREIVLTVSMGLALGAASELTADELLAHADLALYRAKNSGRSCYALFDEPTREEVRESSNLQADLRAAFAQNELLLFYQPEIDLRTGRILSIEALLRWGHPQRGLMEATEVLPLVYQAGLGTAVRKWVCREACSQAQRWISAGLMDARIKVTVNLSEEDLHCEELSSHLQASLSEAGVAAHYLLLECPEAVLMEHTRLAERRIQTLRNVGLELVIDSFGARFGSLRLLECLPIHAIKLDRSLLDDTSGNPSILRAICAIAQDLHVDVTAKCIETPAQHELALQVCCDRGQGYLFSPPVSGDEMTGLLRAGRRLPATPGGDAPALLE